MWPAVRPALRELRRRAAAGREVLCRSAARVRARKGDTDAALEHGRQALEWAATLQNLVMQGAALTARGAALLTAGRLDEAGDHIERSIEVGRTVSRSNAALTTLPLLAETHLRRGDARAQIAAGELADAEAGIAGAADRAKELGARDLLPCIEEARAELARSRGDAAGCERAFRDAARLHRENGDAWLATQVEARLAV